MANSTAAERRKKPRPDFPHFSHRNGRRRKKVRGNAIYFTRWTEDPRGDEALQLWEDQKDDLLAGRKPRRQQGGLTVQDLCNEVRHHKCIVRSDLEGRHCSADYATRSVRG